MIQPRMTLYGMYKYDPTLFDGVILPDGMDKTIMVNQIIRQSGDLFPYYQVPPEVKTAITEWFTRRKDNFAKLWQGFTAEYNPIETMIGMRTAQKRRILLTRCQTAERTQAPTKPTYKDITEQTIHPTAALNRAEPAVQTVQTRRAEQGHLPAAYMVTSA